MKRTVRILALILACMLVFAGCQETCEHEWAAADCDTPKTCELCDETKGAPKGHVWLAATCDAPKTCEVCKETEGEALGHTWTDATCTAPKTCTTCKLTEGEALAHTWVDATTEAPKTCSSCGKTEGSPLEIETDPRFNAEACKVLFGRWESRREITAEDLGLTGMTGSYTDIQAYTFHNDGTLIISNEIENVDTCKTLLMAQTMNDYYADYDSKEAAEQAMWDDRGCTVEQYAAAEVDSFLAKWHNTFMKDVYYVSDDGSLYISEYGDWESEMERHDFYIEDDVLNLIDSEADYIDLTRA